MLDADIKGAFDNINHEYILKAVDKLPGRELIKQWLKAGYVEAQMFHEMFSYVDYMVHKILWKWALKRHPGKGKKWVKRKYFRTLKGRQWTFAVDVKDRRNRDKIISIVRIAEIPITRHVKVKGTSSPDDPTLARYWEERQTSTGKTRWDKNSKYYRVAENQKWKCPVCDENLFNGEELHTHHLTRVKDGGTDDESNLIHVHKACHLHIHTGKQSREPLA